MSDAGYHSDSVPQGKTGVMSRTAPNEEHMKCAPCRSVRRCESPGSTTCHPHRDAVLAKSVFSVGKACLSCHRTIRKTDYVFRDHATQHVRCEPVIPRQSREAIRESEKPLFTKADNL